MAELPPIRCAEHAKAKEFLIAALKKQGQKEVESVLDSNFDKCYCKDCWRDAVPYRDQGEPDSKRV
jgi:hypothetical protein